MANKRNGTIYTGVTNDLKRRVQEHKEKVNEGFTKEYNVTNLVYFEYGDSIQVAIDREKQVKNWKRAWKLELIEKENPTWRDLYDEI